MSGLHASARHFALIGPTQQSAAVLQGAPNREHEFFRSCGTAHVPWLQIMATPVGVVAQHCGPSNG